MHEGLEALADDAVESATTPTKRVSGARAHGGSSATCDIDCPICFSPVMARASGDSLLLRKGARSAFRTQCCGKLFHLQCMQKHKGTSVRTVCPLCRSEQPTGLTPARRITGFVSSSSDLERSAMLTRVQAARAAVQRSLVAGR